MGYIKIEKSNKLKKTRVFINSNGEIIKGGIEEHFGNKTGHNLGGNKRPSRFSEENQK